MANAEQNVGFHVGLILSAYLLMVELEVGEDDDKEEVEDGDGPNDED